MTHTPTIGRIVHYYQGDFEAPSNYSDAQRHAWTGTNGTRVHPAMITHVHTDSCVNLMVFWDAGTPAARTSMTVLPDEVFAEGMHCTNSGWRWPPRV
jgi:hypothetical protein